MLITKSELANGYDPHPLAIAFGEGVERSGWKGHNPVLVEAVVNSRRTSILVKYNSEIIHIVDFADD
ncbi:MAG: hypothetical protein A2062_05900 [Omnitrophica WOR_2 bacterium GWA2_44_7]|nr:MAG: hypothetical protein A2062_05900 [Omnitrophica WOR_2 bacterium GWA2_44_7]